MDRFECTDKGMELASDGDWLHYADAQAQIEALQAQITTLKRHAGLDCGDQHCLYALTHSGMRTNGGCRCSPQRMKDDLERSRKAAEALQRERDAFIQANTKEPINEPVTYRALAGARAVARLAFNELTKMTKRRDDLQTALDAEREKVQERNEFIAD